MHKFHETKEKSGYEGFADKAWCDYCHKPFVKENSTLLRHLQRHHKKELCESSGEQEEASLALAYKGRESTLIAKKGHIEQHSTAKSVPFTDNEHDTAMQLLAQAWYDNLLPPLPLLADSLSFNKLIACISRGSFRMPGRSKLPELIYDINAKMLLRLKALLQQSTSVSLTTDAAKMPTGDSHAAVTCDWISTDWCLMSAVLGVSISDVSHTAEEIVPLLNELGVKYTLDDRLDAIATDNGANFVAAMEELLETGICEEHVRCACHTLQLSIKNYIDPAKPKNAPAAPTNPTSDLVSTFRKLVNKTNASPLMTENLRTAQIGGPAAELIMEEADD